uniref:NADH-ubiquinone oxidoreductase chain 4 n=1 Tax=Terapon jarbua TaxID=163131 RepID=A0A3Q8AMK7_TERJA|nr:NADH dehydrogenase subunit 4 [Terapon jarbua]
MLKVLIPTLMLIPTTWVVPAKWLWPTALFHSLAVALVSLTWLASLTEAGWTSLNQFIATDPLSTPLLVLTCWLLPLMILASQNHTNSEPVNRQRMYISLLTSLQIFLILAFGATEVIMFYVMFEATLIPTLILITRWGNQTERLNAGTYFLFYTLAGSLPLLVALLLLHNTTGTLSLLVLQYSSPIPLTTYADKLWWAACLLAFLVKMPLYGAHLWLPKAHVEAPVAGSMVLAAVLLKLGGYGMMRMMIMLEPLTKQMSYPFIIFALWGIVMTGSICLRQTDLKSLMPTHPVTWASSSAAFSKHHEVSQEPYSNNCPRLNILRPFLPRKHKLRTHPQSNNSTSSSLQIALPLMTTWWFIASLANLALPPLPNLMGELMIIISLFNWSWWTLLLTGAGTLITASYSLYMFLMTQRGPLPAHMTALAPSHSREHLLIALHLLPLLLLILKPELIWGWTF